jgi:hypothetical protein
VIAKNYMLCAPSEEFNAHSKPSTIAKDKHALAFDRNTVGRKSPRITVRCGNWIGRFQAGTKNPSPFQQEACHRFRHEVTKQAESNIFQIQGWSSLGKGNWLEQSTASCLGTSSCTPTSFKKAFSS